MVSQASALTPTCLTHTFTCFPTPRKDGCVDLWGVHGYKYAGMPQSLPFFLHLTMPKEFETTAQAGLWGFRQDFEYSKLSFSFINEQRQRD